jgi:diguanylate cyclase (GGDEF)-like protein
MLTFRSAFIAAALSVAVVPSTVAAAGPSDDTVRELADSAAELVAEEQVLLDSSSTDPTTSSDSSTTSSTTSRLRIVDRQGAMLLERLDDLGINVTEASRAALSPLPAPGDGFAPPSQVYDAAVDDLLRVSATPAAALAPSDGGSGPALGLLAVAAMSLLVLGAAALGNTLRRRDSDDDLAAMAWSDGLTGLANRRRLDHDIATQDLVDEPVATIMIDVDHFKAVNDRFGHQEGDEILRRVAAMLSAHVRYDDVVYRYGGEEFCILLPGASRDDAVGVADRIVQAARTIELPDETHVTISVGVAHVAESPASTTIEAADKALIAAKSAGRDRAVDAADLDPAATVDADPATELTTA